MGTADCREGNYRDSDCREGNYREAGRSGALARRHPLLRLPTADRARGRVEAVESAAVRTPFLVIIALPGGRLGFVASLVQEIVEDVVRSCHTRTPSMTWVISSVVVFITGDGAVYLG